MRRDASGAEKPSREWFRDWFGEEYLELYPHRDEAEAGRAVRLFLETAAPASGLVLDLACGAGRHLRELRGSGVEAVGLDLSAALIREARRSSPEAWLVRGDMRYLPFADAAFGGLTSFFTSFGYFESPAEDLRVAREIRRVLRPGGRFMLDFFNADRVRDELIPYDQKELDGRTVTQVREIVDDTVVKRIRIREDRGDGMTERHFEERVRLYSAGALEALLRAAGLQTERRHGNYGGADFGSDAERLILSGAAS